MKKKHTLQVENVTSSGRKPGLKEKFHKLTKEKKITFVLATCKLSQPRIWCAENISDVNTDSELMYQEFRITTFGESFLNGYADDFE